MTKIFFNILLFMLSKCNAALHMERADGTSFAKNMNHIGVKIIIGLVFSGLAFLKCFYLFNFISIAVQKKKKKWDMKHYIRKINSHLTIVYY